MSTTIEKLLVLQDRDRTILHLAKEQADIPARKSQIETRLQKHKDEQKHLQDEIKKATATAKETEVEIDARKAKIAKFREQQLQIKNNVEYRALEHEIAVVQKEIRDLEDRELEVMEAVEKINVQVVDHNKILKDEESLIKADGDVLDKRAKAIQDELDGLKKDRQAMVQEIDPAWLSRYEKIFNKKGDYALVPVDNGTCGGCHMKLPPHLVHDVKKNLTMTLCNFCSRLLYWQP